jgi:ribose transport system substrate-binding protein
MANLRFIVSLITKDNDYQVEQAAAALAAAQKLGVDVQILYADNDAITQSTQLLRAIQSDAPVRPHAIIFEPAGGTAFPQVAKAAVSAKIAWVALNREADYIPQLRKAAEVPVFTISSDHKEIGRIQGRQFTVLLPKGGSVLYIQGPSENSAARDRTGGDADDGPAQRASDFAAGALDGRKRPAGGGVVAAAEHIEQEAD